ncbi:hypothetical protein, partial [Staphylococcus aureus]
LVKYKSEPGILLGNRFINDYNHEKIIIEKLAMKFNIDPQMKM